MIEPNTLRTPSKPWQEVRSDVYNSWTTKSQFLYNAKRDLATAEDPNTDPAEIEWYLWRAEMYTKMAEEEGQVTHGKS